MAWIAFSPEYPVIVCGVKDGEITEDGLGSQLFSNFDEAKQVFPDLDPDKGSERFTWAAKGGDRLTRFETRKANDLYSS